MNKSKILTPNVVEKIDAVIDAFNNITDVTAEERASIDARIAVLEWLKSGRKGTVKVDGTQDQ